jgi:hypothetical protein
MATRIQSPDTYGDNNIFTGNVRQVARRGGVANYAPVFSTTKITDSYRTNSDNSAATPSAPTSASGTGAMESLAGSFGGSRWALYVAGGLVLWMLWRRGKK